MLEWLRCAAVLFVAVCRRVNTEQRRSCETVHPSLNIAVNHSTVMSARLCCGSCCPLVNNSFTKHARTS